MNLRRNGKRRRLKIGIRPQLIILVGFSSLFSLLILAVITGVYYSNNLTSLRAERLEVIAQIKSTQVQQSIQYLWYQTYWVSIKEEITTPLSSHRAGNNSASIFSEAQTALDTFLLSSEMFALAVLYDLKANVVAESYSNITTVSSTLDSVLYVLGDNTTVPSSLFNSTSSSSSSSLALTTAYFTGPLPNSTFTNDTQTNSTYFVGITLPVYSNSSIIVESAAIAGYLTVVATASLIQTSLLYYTLSGDNKYSVSLVKAYYQNDTVAGDGKYAIGFELIFPSDGDTTLEANRFYTIDSSEAVKEALVSQNGVIQNAKTLGSEKVAAGYATMDVDGHNYWTVMITQTKSTFTGPMKKLRNIMIGVVIGIGAFMCLITFPLAVWFVAPITRLKNATEAITKSRKQKTKNGEDPMFAANDDSKGGGGGGGGNVIANGEEEDEKIADKVTKSKRTSINSAASGSTAFSTGIRLPDRIPPSKKLFKDELTELLEAFNIMTAELEKQYTHLEDRVKSRTKELEASKIEAEAANESKTIFIANISHELRTPLNGILGMTSIAMDDNDPLLIHDSLKLIHRSGELLLHILTELLTYSKNTLNRSKLEKSNFQVLEILYQIKSIFGKLAYDQRVNLNITLRPNIMRKLILFGDSNRIIQVVMNFVSNSLKFTPVDGHVDVTFRLLGEYDEERSKAANYEKVYVKKGTSLKTSNDDASLKKGRSRTSNQCQNGNGATSTTKSDGASKLLHNSLKDDLNDDARSILTLSTTEYENAVFNSQFNFNKSLPATPRTPHSPSPATSVNSSSEINNTPKIAVTAPSTPVAPNAAAETTPIISDEEIADNDVAIDILTLQNNAEPEGESPGSAEFNGSHDTPMQKISRRTLKQLSVTGLLSSSELVKNEKVFKMRKLYVPRSWVFQIEVKDTGSGIEPALQEKVFEPFIQGDQTLSRSYGGTGLGLSICRQLAKMMQGTLTLKSTLGQGSTFTFTVPLRQTGEIIVPDEEMEEFCNDVFNPDSKVNKKVAFDFPESHEFSEDTPDKASEMTPSSNSNSYDKDGIGTSPASPHKYGFQIKLPLRHDSHLSSTGTAQHNKGGISFLDDMSHLRILVAEDNSVNQEVIRRMLRLEGFTNVTMASNGLEAVDYIKRSYDTLEFFNIIFMDVQMPKMDGLTATKLIRNNLKFTNPIIALTAFADESNVKECLNAGMSGFLSKPIKRTNLRQILTEFSTEVLSEIVTTPVTYTDDDERRLA